MDDVTLGQLPTMLRDNYDSSSYREYGSALENSIASLRQ